MVPKDFPPWQRVYDHFSRWCQAGVWEAALDAVNRHHRKKGRSAAPHYGIIDSQSVETQYDREERGIDGGKRVNGRKRPIVVDILGHRLHVGVQAAKCHDRVGSRRGSTPGRRKASQPRGFLG